MKIAASAMEGIQIVTVGEPQLVASNVESIKSELGSIISPERQKVILDLGPVSFMDSSGVGLLVSTMKTVTRGGGALRVAGLGAQPLALVRTVCLDRVIPLSRDVDEALKALGGARAEARRAMDREEEQQAIELAGKIEQMLTHATLSYEALFGTLPDTLERELRRVFETEILKRAGTSGAGDLALDGHLQAQRRQILGEMAQGMAGRFRNVLSLIIGRLQFLRMVTADEKICSSLDIMEKAAVQGIAALKRVEEFCEGAANRRMGRIGLRQVLDDALEMVRMKGEDDLARAGKHLRVIREFVGSPLVLGCAAELKHAFVDILLNALEAMAEGGVLTVSVNQSSDTVTVSIADTGRGMAPESLERAFEPLYSTKGVPGAGLGLAIARGVLERHQGSITLESHQGRGTIVTIHLPAAPEEATSEPPRPVPVGADGTHASGRVLVVDDEAMVCDLLKDILGTMGCEVVARQSGREGVDEFRVGRFDLVMTDLAMPGLNGWEVAREIRTLDPTVPVALFSAWGSQMDAAVMSERGVDFLFPKPFEISMIRHVLSAALDLGASRRARQ